MNITHFYDSTSFKTLAPRIYEFNGRTVATNGQILISIPSNGTGNKIPKDARQPLIALLAGIKKQAFISLQKIKLPTPITCSSCLGRKKATTVPCDDCRGEGEVQIKGYEWVDCPKCNGDCEITTIGGDNDCPTCHGAGTTLPGQPYIEVRGLYIHPRHLNIIAYEPSIEVATDLAKKCLYFRAKQQVGVILGAHA